MVDLTRAPLDPREVSECGSDLVTEGIESRLLLGINVLSSSDVKKNLLT